MSNRKSRILILDEQPESMALLLPCLCQEGFEVEVAEDAAEALRRTILSPPDLILMDVIMRDNNGLAVCQQLRSLPHMASAPVIVLSRLNSESEKRNCLQAGCSDFIAKPFDEKEVVARIHTHLRLRDAGGTNLLASLPSVQPLLSGPEVGAEDKLFARSMAILEKHVASPITVAQLARSLGTNEARLSRLFRERLNMSVTELRTELRLDHAARWLATTNMQIQQISERAGYKNPGDFTRAFRQRYEQTPSEYRRLHKP